MRLFVGIPLSPVVTGELSAILRRLRSSGDELRWSVPESWHITLQFLGNSSQEQYEQTVAQLRKLCLSPVSIRLEGLGFFERVGIFFAGVAVSPELLQLQECVTMATASGGFVPETRPYQPHITLARSKGQDKRQSLRELGTRMNRQPTFTKFVAKEFLLYESFLGSAGSRYEVRERFPLGELYRSVNP